MVKWLVLFLLITTPCYAGISLDGTDDYCTVANAASINFADEDFTLCAWLTNSDWTGNPGAIIYKGNIGAGGIRYALEYYFSDPELYLEVGVDDNSTFSYANSDVVGDLSNNVWYLICGTRDTTNNLMKTWINGVEKGSAADNTGSIADQNNRDLLIGASGDSVSYPKQDYGGSTYSEVMIWDKLLTAGNMLSIYNAKLKRQALQVESSNLVLYLTLDEGKAGTTSCNDASAGFYKDISGNNNNATCYDGAGAAGLTCEGENALSYP